jgi:hypothetical protein
LVKPRFCLSLSWAWQSSLIRILLSSCCYWAQG